MTDANKAAFDARIIEKETHIAVVADNVVLGSFTGPKCKEHAELFLSALTSPAANTGDVPEWAKFERVEQDDGEITYESHGRERNDDRSRGNTFICIEGIRAKEVANKITTALAPRQVDVEGLKIEAYRAWRSDRNTSEVTERVIWWTIDHIAQRGLIGNAAQDGWQLVPVEPTEEMLEIIDDSLYGAFQTYERLLAAAPKPEGE